MSDISNLSDTIIPKSQQLNAEELLTGPITITVTDVRRGDSEEQPLTIHYQGDDGRPFKPCKTSRKVLIFAWGEDGREWIGKRMTLFNDPEVKFGGVKVGGIRISHLSDIERDIAIALTVTKGKKAPTIIQRLTEHPVFASIRAAATLPDLEALRPQMKGVDGAVDAAKKRAAEIRAAEAPAATETNDDDSSPI